MHPITNNVPGCVRLLIRSPPSALALTPLLNKGRFEQQLSRVTISSSLYTDYTPPLVEFPGGRIEVFKGAKSRIGFGRSAMTPSRCARPVTHFGTIQRGVVLNQQGQRVRGGGRTKKKSASVWMFYFSCYEKLRTLHRYSGLAICLIFTLIYYVVFKGVK